ncbi:MAG: DUF5683 domain-containing protein [Salibacteraceae bacterium]
MALKKHFFLLLIILTISYSGKSQTDTTDQLVVKVESTEVIEGTQADSSLMKIHSPKKAAIFSAIIPGAGQVYNKKYWKLPLIYGAGIGMVYILSTNYKSYEKYRESYITRVDSTSTGTDYFPTISNSGLQSEIERTQKNYELAAVGIALVYILQIVDATVDAHLKTFDVSDDLSLAIRPAILSAGLNYQTGISPTVGLKLNLRLK